MKRERLGPVELWEQMVRPRLTVDLVYGAVKLKGGGRYRRLPPDEKEPP
jgi:hypothetical protein